MMTLPEPEERLMKTLVDQSQLSTAYRYCVQEGPQRDAACELFKKGLIATVGDPVLEGNSQMFIRITQQGIDYAKGIDSRSHEHKMARHSARSVPTAPTRLSPNSLRLLTSLSQKIAMRVRPLSKLQLAALGELKHGKLAAEADGLAVITEAGRARLALLQPAKPVRVPATLELTTPDGESVMIVVGNSASFVEAIEQGTLKVSNILDLRSGG